MTIFTLFIRHIIPSYVDLCGCVYQSPNYINTHWLVRALYFPLFLSLYKQTYVIVPHGQVP